jgi:hypothetical protein
MTIQYFNKEEFVFAWLLAACIVTNFCGQIAFLTLLNNNSLTKADALKEAALVLLGAHPIVETYYTTTGKERGVGERFDHETKLFYQRVFEMGFENIGGSMVQSYALVQSEHRSRMAIFSVLSSILTTAMMVAATSFEVDTSNKKRAVNPEFYGE